jgi:hypothetical protein
VTVRKLESTDAFLVTDLADSPRAVGVVRCAPKVLVDGAETLARAATYAFATFGVRASGASAGINAKPEDKEKAVSLVLEELAPLIADGSLHLSPGTGVTADDLAPAALEPQDESLGARGAVAAAAAFLGGGAGGKTAAISAPGSWLDRVGPWWADVGGGAIAEGGADAEVEVLFLGGKAGVLDDALAAGVRARLVVPLTPVPVTAKAYAVLSRAGTVLLPDAVSCAAPLLAVADPDGGDPLERVASAAGELAGSGVDAWRAMVEKAEAFLATWQPALPFGRPLA